VIASQVLALAAACSSSNHATSDGGRPGDAAPGVGGSSGGAGSATTGGAGGAGTGGAAVGSGGAAGGGSTGASGSVAGTGGGAAGTGGGADASAGGSTGGSSPPVCDPTCGAHQRCMLQGSAPTCACVTGYQMSASGCVWGPVPADPGFQNVPAGAWTLPQAATIDATAAGYLDPGELHLSRSAACAGGGATRQSISMPALSDAEPLAITVVANASCITTQGSGCWALDMETVINGRVISVVDQVAPYIVQSGCLGERAYGGTFDLVVRPRGREACSTMFKDAIVDHVQITPSSTCPMPGTLPDGDFDGTTNVWRTLASGADGFTPVAEISPTLGTGGSAAAHLALRGGCESAFADALMSPPLSMPGLALKVHYKGTAGVRARVFVDNATMAVLTGTGEQASANVCLLEANKGMTQRLMLGLGDLTSLPGSSTSCGAITQDFVFDDLELVSDASCPTTANLADGGFERTDPAVAWDSGLQHGGVLVSQTGDTVGVDATAANVHSGARALKIVNSDGCGVRKAAFPATVPASTTTAGPALQFFYKAPALTRSLLTVTTDGGVPSDTLPASPAYTQAEVCLDPALAGQTVSVELSLSGNATCGLQPSESAWFDDFAVTTSAACPAQ